jgi:hypothetical protein
MIADDSPDGENFEQTSEALAMLLPPSFQIERTYVRDFASGEQAREKILHLINRGALLVNYAGHGSPDFWARERLLRNEDAPYLGNQHKYPFMVMLTCLTGAFEDPTRHCLAEKIIKVKNGAIASWAASAFILVSQYFGIGAPLYASIMGDENVSFGALVTRAKLGYLSTRIARSCGNVHPVRRSCAEIQSH